jgi:proteasome lid subunit RPN8/RPN11
VLAEFYDVAASNTLANIETCGILCGKFVQPDGEDLPAGVDATTADDDDDDAFPAAADGSSSQPPPPRPPKKSFRVTHVLIPRQTATADTCNAMDEEHIYGVQDEMKLLTLGWIHTHPSQSCFLSSVDLHTHFGYQLMLSSAVAIVLAPRFQPNSGVFRCTDQGMQVLTKCTGRGFHKHEEPFPLFENAAHHRWTDAHRAQFLDLRLQPTVAGQPHALAQLEANNNAAAAQHMHSHGPHHGHPH